jgi:branched-chain amino acid aminotransferase
MANESGGLMKETWIKWSDGSFVESHYDGGGYPAGFNFSLHYGPVVWEGIRSYQFTGPFDIQKINIVFLDEHIDRLFRSAKALGMEPVFTQKDIKQAIIDYVWDNALDTKEFYIRPVMYIDAPAEGVQNKEFPTKTEIFFTPIREMALPKREIKVCISNQTRGYPQHQMQIKNSANYVVNDLAYKEAKRQGFDDALLQTPTGHIAEATVANLFVMNSNGRLYTPPNDGNILEGCTRNWVIKNVGAEERPITKYDLYTAKLVFLTGTFVEMARIKQVDHAKLGGEKLFAEIHAKYKEWINVNAKF